MHEFELDIVPSPTRPCRVRVGKGALDALVRELSGEGLPLVVLSDSNVAPLHAAPLAGRLRGEGHRVEELVFPAGESSKTRETKESVEDRMLELGLGRRTVLIAVGGGVTGDLGGFVAATWHRGIPVVQVPTSLLAMVDASIGGKTAVNLEHGKNLVGCFHQPRAIYADIDLLATLPDDEYVSGFAEIVKAATIADETLFELLESASSELRRRDGEWLERVVLRSMGIKGDVVRDDERESGVRAVLNFGHTVAHAVETASDYRVGHGRAVAVGMCVEARLAVRFGGFPEEHLQRLERLVAAVGLPTRVDRRISTERLVAATYRDKKTRGDEVHYALPSRIGRMPATATRVVAEDDLRRVLEAMTGD